MYDIGDSITFYEDSWIASKELSGIVWSSGPLWNSRWVALEGDATRMFAVTVPSEFQHGYVLKNYSSISVSLIERIRQGQPQLSQDTLAGKKQMRLHVDSHCHLSSHKNCTELSIPYIVQLLLKESFRENLMVKQGDKDIEVVLCTCITSSDALF